MNPNGIVKAFCDSFEKQRIAHIEGDFDFGPTLAMLSERELAAVRTLVLQAARNVATSIACDVDEALEGRAA